MEKVTLELFRQYRIPQTVKVSPDGTKIAVTVQTVNNDEDGYNYKIWVKDGEEFKPFTGLGKENSFIFDDNNTLLFPALRDETDKKKAAEEDFTVFYRVSLNGGEAQKAFKVPVKARNVQKLGEGVYLITAFCDATVADYYKMTAEEKKAVADDRKKNKDFNVIDETPFWLNGMPGFQNKMRNRLFLYEEETDTITPASSALFEVQSTAVIGDNVYYSGYEYSQTNPLYKDVMCFNTKTKEICTVVKNTKYDNSRQAVAAYNGKLVFMAADASKYGGSTHPDFFEVNTETGELTLICEGDYSFGAIVNTPEAFLFNSMQRYSNTVFSFNDEGIKPVFDWNGSITSFDEQNGTLVFTGLHELHLNEVYAVVDGKAVQISNFNDDLLKDYYVAEAEPMTITRRGWEIDGYISKPFDYDPAKKYPAILYIHGGPKGVFYPIYQHVIQLWASQGYFVFYCNPQGSDGRGNDFAEIRRMTGGPDYEDIMAFTDAVLEKYPSIDTERMGVTGVSYGGFMTNWIIGHTNRFHAASSQCSVVNWVSMYGVSDISRLYVKELMGGSPWDEIETYWKCSPLAYANNCVTPTLFIQPLDDFRCHLSDGLQMVTSLMDHGCETRVVTFEGDSHGLNNIGKPSHRERSFTETLNWMNSHLDNN